VIVMLRSTVVAPLTCVFPGSSKGSLPCRRRVSFPRRHELIADAGKAAWKAAPRGLEREPRDRSLAAVDQRDDRRRTRQPRGSIR
jgi:hypothetical protein